MHATAPLPKHTLSLKQKKYDPNWIERDVVLEEIDEIARPVGFTAGLCIVPISHPLSLQIYSMDGWARFRKGKRKDRWLFTDQLASLNYWDRVIFYVEKPTHKQ